MKKFTRVFALLLAAMMVFSLAACNNGGSNGDTHEISFWIPLGDDINTTDWSENPIIKYIEQYYEFNGKNITFDFYIAPPGSQSENFSTLIATGEYCDVMSLSMAPVSVTEMYSEGMLWDLTDLIAEHMPNYTAFMEENPELQQYQYTYVDGEAKILSLRGYYSAPEPNFEGFVYRRDWIAKYGTHPVTGEKFEYGYTDPSDSLTWYDNVVFPNGTDEPLYISDWEWMFEIFEKAMADQGVTDGYCFSPYYLGYMATGDLYSGFGGGAPHWYYDGEKIVYGITDDNMRAYLQCLNTWYKKGWINQTFDEQTADMFFMIDTASVYQGKVGLWCGMQSAVGTQLQGDGYLEGIVVYGCRQPINDIYGGEEQKNKEPNMMYQYTRYGEAVVLTNKMTEEEVIAFLEFTDFFYTEEGSLLGCYGLNKEQYEACQDPLYTELGLTEGAYEFVEIDGETKVRTYLDSTSPLAGCVVPNRLATRMSRDDRDYGYDRYMSQAAAAWDYYTADPVLPYSVTASISVEQDQQITKLRAPLDQFLAQTIAPMIKGEQYDVWDDAAWQQFVTHVNKYRAEQITAIYQEILDSVGA